MPVVSVIIPNYNHAPYLHQRIDSVLNQTYNDLEVIILDDCSTDNSKAVIEQYRNYDKVSNIIYNTENSGNPFQQWGKGIQHAQGKYIWIAESDDWCEPTLLKTIVTGLEQNENCVLGYCQSYCVNDDGSIRFQSHHKQLQEYIDGKKFISSYILPSNPIFNAGMAVWKKEVYQQISKDFISYKRIGDYLFWIEIAACGDVFISGKLLNYFRAHDKNVSGDALKSGMSFIDHIPLNKRLLERRLINQKDYSKAIKKSYAQFRLSNRYYPSEVKKNITKLFTEYGGSVVKLKIYYYLKQTQLYCKTLLRV